jgi:hypothetical protein
MLLIIYFKTCICVNELFKKKETTISLDGRSGNETLYISFVSTICCCDFLIVIVVTLTSFFAANDLISIWSLHNDTQEAKPISVQTSIPDALC